MWVELFHTSEGMSTSVSFTMGIEGRVVVVPLRSEWMADVTLFQRVLLNTFSISGDEMFPSKSNSI